MVMRLIARSPAGQRYSSRSASWTKSRLSQRPSALLFGGQWLGQQGREALLIAVADFFAVEVTAIGKRRQRALA
ncbi:MAG TPA: hypothetical protein VLA28_10945, partial [Afifellaceae bacterium]|nr:hypothetical protein [Afifellaceae bacterium]